MEMIRLNLQPRLKNNQKAEIFSLELIRWKKPFLSQSFLRTNSKRLLKAASFSADAALDALIFASRAILASIATRRSLWLRAWPADYQSKSIVTAYPFQGGCLFGDPLDKILVETQDKKQSHAQVT